MHFIPDQGALDKPSRLAYDLFMSNSQYSRPVLNHSMRAYLSALGRLGGQRTSEAKRKAARRNGRRHKRNMNKTLSYTALLEIFKRHGIIYTKNWGPDYTMPWTAVSKGFDAVTGKTELEAVRALCREMGIVCEL